MKKVFIIMFLLVMVGCNDVTTYNYVTCQFNCRQEGFESGACVANMDIVETDMTIGNCVAEGSINCQNLGLCQCVCGDDVMDNAVSEVEITENEFQPNDFESIVIDNLLQELKNETRMDFGGTELTGLKWYVDEEVTNISAKKVSAWNQEVNGQMLVKMFFEMHGWESDSLNSVAETYQSQLGWQKDEMVCLLKSEIYLEAGVPSGDNQYTVACGIKD